MAALKARLTEMVDQLFSQSKLTEAINYALNHWDGLRLFLRDGRIEVDSNTVERSMRPIAMGRRNSLFSGSEGGAERPLFSLVKLLFGLKLFSHFHSPLARFTPPLGDPREDLSVPGTSSECTDDFREGGRSKAQ